MSEATQQGWTTDEAFENWDEVSTEAPPPLEPNLYVARIIKTEPKPTATKKPGVSIELSVISVHGGDVLKVPRKMFDFAVVDLAGAFRVKQLSQAAGVDPPKANNFAAVSAWASELLGHDVIVRTKIEKYRPKGSSEERENAKVDRYETQERLNAKAALDGGADAGERPVRAARARGAKAA
jgi:hypothetical protein